MKYIIPDRITEIDMINVRLNISNDVTSVICPSTLEIIGKGTFSFYKSLEEVVLNEGLKIIEDYVFIYTNIKSIVLPSTLKKIGNYVFSCCNNLSEIIIRSNCYLTNYSENKLSDLFGCKAKIIISDELIEDSEFDIIKKVSDEERYKLGVELFKEISSDDIDIDKVKDLLLNGADTEIRDNNGNTGLMLMINKNINNIARMYMLSGCDINARNKYGETPLIIACRNNNNDIAMELINRDCILDIETVFDESAKSIAISNGNILLANEIDKRLNNISDYINSELDDIAKIRRKLK